MAKKTNKDDTDVAVLEYRNEPGEWNVLEYIGPDRTEGLVEEYSEGAPLYRGCDLRIRYLEHGLTAEGTAHEIVERGTSNLLYEENSKLKACLRNLGYL